MFRRIVRTLTNLRDTKTPAAKICKARLHLETLESRIALAGNVTASVIDGDLVIRGDDLGNSIQVRQVSANKFTVRGLSTTVNGSSTTKTFTGVVDDVRIAMMGGNDVVDMKGPNTDQMVIIPDDLDIDGGSGNDRIDLQCVHVRDDIEIETGSGKNVVKGVFLYADDDMTIRKSAQKRGDFDTVAITYGGAGNKGDGTLKIDLHDGADRVYLYNFLTDGLEIETDGGDDYVSLVYTQRDRTKGNYVNAGAGRDTVNLFQNSSKTSPNGNFDPPLNGVEVITRTKLVPPAV